MIPIARRARSIGWLPLPYTFSVFGVTGELESTEGSSTLLSPGVYDPGVYERLITPCNPAIASLS